MKRTDDGWIVVCGSFIFAKLSFLAFLLGKVDDVANGIGGLMALVFVFSALWWGREAFDKILVSAVAFFEGGLIWVVGYLVWHVQFDSMHLQSLFFCFMLLAEMAIMACGFAVLSLLSYRCRERFLGDFYKDDQQIYLSTFVITGVCLLLVSVLTRDLAGAGLSFGFLVLAIWLHWFFLDRARTLAKLANLFGVSQ